MMYWLYVILSREMNYNGSICDTYMTRTAGIDWKHSWIFGHGGCCEGHICCLKDNCREGRVSVSPNITMAWKYNN